MHAFFRSFSDVEAFLSERGLFHIDLSLTRMQRALQTLSLQTPSFKVIQVLGTNGKGSTSAVLASLCQAHGLRTGLYTSPHFVSPRERIQVAEAFGQHFFPCTEDEWIEAANIVHEADCGLTYFEFVTLIALVLFTKRNVQVAVLEAGLGGAHDATTAIARQYLAYTPIALDHCNVLGGTLEAIATDKALAMAEGMQVFSAIQFPKAANCLKQEAARHGLTLHEAQPLPTALRSHLRLRGSHQYTNAGLALTLFSALQKELTLPSSDSFLASGLASAFLPGRLQLLPATKHYPPLLLDGAHNPHGMQALLHALFAMHCTPSVLAYACLADKDWPNTIRLLKQSFAHIPVVFPRLTNERATDPQTVEAYWTASGLSGDVLHPEGSENDRIDSLLATLTERSEITPSSPVLLTGSLYLLSEFYTVYPQTLEQGALLSL